MPVTPRPSDVAGKSGDVVRYVGGKRRVPCSDQDWKGNQRAAAGSGVQRPGDKARAGQNESLPYGQIYGHLGAFLQASHPDARFGGTWSLHFTVLACLYGKGWLA